MQIKPGRHTPAREGDVGQPASSSPFGTLPAIAGALAVAIGTILLVTDIAAAPTAANASLLVRALAASMHFAVIVAGAVVWLGSRQVSGFEWISRLAGTLVLLALAVPFFVERKWQLAQLVTLFVGIGVLSISFKRKVFTQLAAGIAGTLSLLDLERWVVDGRPFTADSIPVVFALAAVCCGILLLTSGSGPMAVISGTGPGAFAAKRILPVVLLLPALLGMIWRIGNIHGFDTGLLNSLVIVGLFVYVVWTGAYALNRIDAEHARANANILASENRYATVVESLPLLVWTCTPAGDCDYLSPQWIHFTGVPAASQLNAGWFEQIHPAERASTSARWAESVHSGQQFEIEHRIRRNDGAYRWFQARAIPVRDGGNRVTKWFGVSSDIEEQVAAKTTMRESDDRLRLALTSAAIGSWDIDPTTGTLICDERCKAAWGQTSEASMDYPAFLDAVHPDDRAFVSDSIEAALRGDRDGEYSVDHRVIGVGDGIIRHVHAQGRAFFAGSGAERRSTRFIGTVQDVTARKLDEETLARANENLRQVAYAAAHDLQEPLRNIALSLDLFKVLGEAKSTDPTHELIEGSISQAHRAVQMVRDLVTFTEITGDAHSQSESVEVNRALSEVLEKLRPLIADTGAQIEIGPMPHLRVMPAHLMPLFQHVIENALKFRKRDIAPLVLVSATRAGTGVWQFTITDNGIGFDQLFSKRIFGVFKRLHLGHEYPGTGMGLAICSQIVSSYGGRIWAESNVGVGSKFKFTLPGPELEGDDAVRG